jgi:hypothetical protein
VLRGLIAAGLAALIAGGPASAVLAPGSPRAVRAWESRWTARTDTAGVKGGFAVADIACQYQATLMKGGLYLCTVAIDFRGSSAPMCFAEDIAPDYKAITINRQLQVESISCVGTPAAIPPHAR